MPQAIFEGHLGGCIRGGDPDTWDTAVWEKFLLDFPVKSIVDIGCGEGHSTKFFSEKGLKALGVEGSKKAIAFSPVPSLMLEHDYTKGPLILPEKYEAAWSCEFVEHVEERYVNNFLATFAGVDVILMTYSEPQHSKGGYHHVNCRPQEYWNEKFQSIGFEFQKEKSLEYRSIATAQWVKPTVSLYLKK